MKFMFYLTVIFTAVEVDKKLSLSDSFIICNEHLREYFPNNKYKLLNAAKKTIFDDNCELKTYHIDILLRIGFVSTLPCEKCIISLSKTKILCKNCNSSGLEQPSCKYCKNMHSIVNMFEFFNSVLRKFILNKFSQETVEYYFEKFKPNVSSVDVIFAVSGISNNFEDFKKLSEVFSMSNKNENPYFLREVSFLKAFIKHHSEFEDKDSISLFKDFVDGNDKYSNSYIFYLALRFDFNFYNTISSKDLLKLILAVTSSRFDLSFKERDTLILNIFAKVNSINFMMDREDFFKLIDCFIDDTEHLTYLFYFIERDNYCSRLTQEKKILILLKMFKFKSIRSICLCKNLRIFNAPANNQVDEENDLADNFNICSFYNQFVETSNNNTQKFTAEYLIYQKVVERLLYSHFGFHPDNLVIMASIFFSFLNPEINQPNIFKDMYGKFCSKQRFGQLTVENVLDLMDLHLIYNISYDYVESTIQPFFDNIKSGDELDIIFNHVFASDNKGVLLGIFVQLYGTKKISESGLNKLIDYLIYNLHDKTKEFFDSIKRKGSISLSFQIKYIQRMIVQPSIENFDFFKCIDKEIFEHFSKNEINSLFQFCLKHGKYNLIEKFCEFLDFEQLKQTKDNGINFITGISTYKVALDLNKMNISRYFGTPIFYFSIPFFYYFLTDVFNSKEDVFYKKTIFESVLCRSPLFQKCFDSSNSDQLGTNVLENNRPGSNVFENAHMVEIVKILSLNFNNERNEMYLLFYESLCLEMKFLLKATIIYNIIFLIEKEIKIHYEMTIDEKISYVKGILDRCIAFPKDLPYERFDLFLNSFDNFLFNFAFEKSPESFRRVILEYDLNYLLKIFVRQFLIRVHIKKERECSIL